MLPACVVTRSGAATWEPTTGPTPLYTETRAFAGTATRRSTSSDGTDRSRSAPTPASRPRNRTVLTSFASPDTAYRSVGNCPLGGARPQVVGDPSARDSTH